MRLILDPPIATKVRKMRSRVRWNAPQVIDQGIDQTRLSIVDELAETPAFSFLVIGDSGFGPQPYGHPQRQVAEYLMAQQADCQFLLHTGDVVYQMGAPEQYPANFIAPYREWLVGGETLSDLSYRHLVFRKPFLTVPGNHDYYNLPFPYGLIVAALQPLRAVCRVPVTTNVSLRGSASGNTYARTFIDYLKDFSNAELVTHLHEHYTTETETGLSLTYHPGQFTRLPNRYYQFRYRGVDFFGLDSSTFNRPLEVDGAAILQGDAAEATLSPDVDWTQLFWLRDRLVASLKNPQVRGRIVYLHHPPYVTETTKRQEWACLSCRRHLRWVLDSVAQRLGATAPQPLVNLVLSGHAHCFEYLRTVETGHADRYLNWIICGGSGARLRSQHPDRSTVEASLQGEPRAIAKSQIYLGRSEDEQGTRWPYSFLRIDVSADTPLKLVIRPFVAERYQEDWQRYELPSLVL